MEIVNLLCLLACIICVILTLIMWVDESLPFDEEVKMLSHEELKAAYHTIVAEIERRYGR